MRNVIIGFSKPKHFKLYAWLIMKFDKANFDHAYLRFISENLNRSIIYQAVGKGVQFIGKTLFEAHSEPIEEYQLIVSDDSYTKLMQFCIDNAGISYGFKQVLGACIVKIAAKFGKEIKNPFANQLHSEFCSEIALRCLNVIDTEKFKDIDPESITPKELQILISNYGAERIL